jgi:3'-phosphoadenosine 5'-phosphosulfate (PAPS) 3'-phosphatase
MTIPDLKSRLDFALEIAEDASKFILGYYQSTQLVVERKIDSSPVTEADVPPGLMPLPPA